MPRTKAPLAISSLENIKPSASVLHQDMIDTYLKAVDDAVMKADEEIENEKKRLKLNIRIALKEQCLKFPHSNSKTIAELKCDKPEFGTFSELTSIKNVSVNTTTSRKVKRHNDTGHVEESRDLSLRPKKQSTIKKAKNVRASRSLSRSKIQQALPTINSFSTPLGQSLSTSTFGLVTPKVKPNTPQVVLRRPKQGEIAISMQGSPLMVGSITTDRKANVNIPLPDGRVLSIQPQRGLRTSQIPDIDAETKRQIETLRDNLNKVCAFSTHK